MLAQILQQQLLGTGSSVLAVFRAGMVMHCSACVGNVRKVLLVDLEIHVSYSLFDFFFLERGYRAELSGWC